MWDFKDLPNEIKHSKVLPTKQFLPLKVFYVWSRLIKTRKSINFWDLLQSMNESSVKKKDGKLLSSGFIIFSQTWLMAQI